MTKSKRKLTNEEDVCNLRDKLMLLNVDVETKLFLVDKKVTVVGSANLDMRSFFFNYEIAASIRNEKSVDNIEDFIRSIESECSPYSEDIYLKSRTWEGQTLEAFSKLIAPLL